MSETRDIIKEAMPILRELDKQDQIIINRYIDALATQRAPPPIDPNRDLTAKLDDYERLVKQISDFCMEFSRKPKERKRRSGMLMISILGIINAWEPYD